MISNHASGHFSSASGNRVWLVYASAPVVMSQASSHSRCASSSRMRMSSGTAMAGCVSFNWMAAFSGKSGPIGIGAAEPAHDVGEGAGNEEVLLDETQALADAGGIVRIEHAGQGFGGQRLGQGADEIAAAEFLKIEVIGRGRRPKPECVDGLAAIADDGPVERDADQSRRAAGDGAQAAAANLERAVQPDFHLLVGPGELPTGPGSGASYRAVPAASRRGLPV